MYRAITGKRLADASERVEEDLAQPPSALDIAIDSAQEAALMKGLALFVRNRTASMADLIQGLGTLPPYVIPQIVPQTVPPPAQEPPAEPLPQTDATPQSPPTLGQKPKPPAPLLILGAVHGLMALLALIWGSVIMAADSTTWSLLYFPLVTAYMVMMYLLGNYKKSAIIPLSLTAVASAVICFIRDISAYAAGYTVYLQVKETAEGLAWWLLFLVPLYIWSFYYLLRDKKYISFRDRGAAWLKAHPKLPKSNRAFLGLHAFFALVSMALGMLPVAEYSMRRLLEGKSLGADDFSFLLLGFLGPVTLAAFLSLLALLRKRDKLAWMPLAVVVIYALIFFVCWISYWPELAAIGVPCILVFLGIYAWTYLTLRKKNAAAST
jgi:hypothetical protein